MKALTALFIGNSQFGVYDVPRMVAGLADADPEGQRIVVKSCLKGGGTLKKHWEDGMAPNTARGMIAEGSCDYVILQDIFNVEETEFQTYVRYFKAMIDSVGSRLVLFGSASILSDYPAGFERIHRAYTAMGAELGVPVVDASYAYYKFIGDPPSMEKLESLFNIDRAHPGLWGAYLYACGIFSALTGHCPIGLPIVPVDTVKSLQEAAWAQYLETATLQPAK